MGNDNASSWAQKQARKFAHLRGEDNADIAIIGGGLTGILSAYFLANEGKRVVLLEADVLGRGATELTTAFITPIIDTSLSEQKTMFTHEDMVRIWDSGEQAVRAYEHLIEQFAIECEFVRVPAVVYAREQRELAYLQNEHDILVEMGRSSTVKEKNDLRIHVQGYWRVEDHAKFHPLKFLSAIIQQLDQKGVRIYECSPAKRLEEKNGKQYVQTAHGGVYANDIIVATYRPFGNPWQTLFKKGMYRSYVVEVEISKGYIPEGIYWDMANPYHYFRVDEIKGAYDRLIFGGEDHRSELPMNPEKNFDALLEHMKGVLGEVPFSIQRRWTGPILEPSDGIPLIGTYAPHRHLAAAFSGNGMTYAMTAAQILSALIVHGAHEWASLYDPRRHLQVKRIFKKGVDYTGEFVGGAVKNTFRPLHRHKK